MTCRAASWLSWVEPAQASAATTTVAPSSAAGSAVEMTQQSVETPASTTVGVGPVMRVSGSPHLPKVEQSTDPRLLQPAAGVTRSKTGSVAGRSAKDQRSK